MIKFEAGQTYSTRSLCDHECVISFTVTKRTKLTVTGSDKHGKVQTFRVSPNYTCTAEQFYPWGRHSMCPIIDATDKVA